MARSPTQERGGPVRLEPRPPLEPPAAHDRCATLLPRYRIEKSQSTHHAAGASRTKSIGYSPLSSNTVSSADRRTNLHPVALCHLRLNGTCISVHGPPFAFRHATQRETDFGRSRTFCLWQLSGYSRRLARSKFAQFDVHLVDRVPRELISRFWGTRSSDLLTVRLSE